jgi:hypothetical protein
MSGPTRHTDEALAGNGHTDEALAGNGHTPPPADTTGATCAALTVSGRRCRNPATTDGPFCGVHTRMLDARREAPEHEPAAFDLAEGPAEPEAEPATDTLTDAPPELARHGELTEAPAEPAPELARHSHLTEEPEPAAELARGNELAAVPAEPAVELTRRSDNIELIVRPSRPWPARSLAIAAATIVVFTLVGALVGYLVASSRTKVYAARAEVTYLLDESVPTDFLRTDRRLATQLVTLRSRSVLAPIADRHGLDVDELRDQVSAEVIESSEVIRIEVRNRDPELAAAIAGEIVTNYGDQVASEADVTPIDTGRTLAAVESDIVTILLDRRDLDQEPDAASVDIAARQIELIDRRDAVADELDDATTETGREALELEARAIDRELITLLGDINVDLGPTPTVEDIAERQVLDQRLTDLLGERTELLAEPADPESAVITPSVLTPPYVLDDPVEPVPLRSALGGGLLGFVVGLIIVFVQRRWWLRDP